MGETASRDESGPEESHNEQHESPKQEEPKESKVKEDAPTESVKNFSGIVEGICIALDRMDHIENDIGTLDLGEIQVPVVPTQEQIEANIQEDIDTKAAWEDWCERWRNS